MLALSDKALVLFRRKAGHRLEPVGVMGAALLHGPCLHGTGNFIGGGQLQRRTVSDAALPSLIAGVGQALLHGLLVEYPAAEQLGQLSFAHSSPSVQDIEISRSILS